MTNWILSKHVNSKERAKSMGNSMDNDKTKKPNKGSAEAESQKAAIKRQLDARVEREKAFFKKDARGRTPLFYAAEKGLEEEVREMIFSLPGTGLSQARNALISIKDNSGLTAADLAEKNGHKAISTLLRSEQGRMDFFE
jgi:ankyrin repeat protein